MAPPNTAGGMLEVDGDRDCGIGASNGRHKFTACAPYMHKNRDAGETTRDMLDGATSS